MRLRVVPVEEAVGRILVHNVADATGRKAFSKGHVVHPDDLEKLVQLGLQEAYVAELEPGDVHEDEAAARLAAACAGDGITASRPTTGRVNFFAAQSGLVRVDTAGLGQINAIDGLTVATLPANSLVQPKRMVATIKVIPFAVPKAALRHAEAIGQAASGLVRVAVLRQIDVGLILTGSDNARNRVFATYEPPIRSRVEELGSHVLAVEYVPEDEQAIALSIEHLLAQGAQMVILAGETSIMDADDITPRGIRRAGGTIEHYGAPVEPGNLLLLAYRDQAPVIGAPGCVKSREANVVDLVLPRLLAGERLGKADVVALGVGGLLV
jgi:molybdenum cofactor cytidylyltransferase